jgi:hypothetical protein
VGREVSDLYAMTHDCCEALAEPLRPVPGVTVVQSGHAELEEERGAQLVLSDGLDIAFLLGMDHGAAERKGPKGRCLFSKPRSLSVRYCVPCL